MHHSHKRCLSFPKKTQVPNKPASQQVNPQHLRHPAINTPQQQLSKAPPIKCCAIARNAGLS